MSVIPIWSDVPLRHVDTPMVGNAFVALKEAYGRSVVSGIINGALPQGFKAGRIDYGGSVSGCGTVVAPSGTIEALGDFLGPTLLDAMIATEVSARLGMMLAIAEMFGMRSLDQKVPMRKGPMCSKSTEELVEIMHEYHEGKFDWWFYHHADGPRPQSNLDRDTAR